MRRLKHAEKVCYVCEKDHVGVMQMIRSGLRIEVFYCVDHEFEGVDLRYKESIYKVTRKGKALVMCNGLDPNDPIKRDY